MSIRKGKVVKIEWLNKNPEKFYIQDLEDGKTYYSKLVFLLDKLNLQKGSFVSFELGYKNKLEKITPLETTGFVHKIYSHEVSISLRKGAWRNVSLETVISHVKLEEGHKVKVVHDVDFENNRIFVKNVFSLVPQKITGRVKEIKDNKITLVANAKTYMGLTRDIYSESLLVSGDSVTWNSSSEINLKKEPIARNIRSLSERSLTQRYKAERENDFEHTDLESFSHKLGIGIYTAKIYFQNAGVDIKDFTNISDDEIKKLFHVVTRRNDSDSDSSRNEFSGCSCIKCSSSFILETQADINSVEGHFKDVGCPLCNDDVTEISSMNVCNVYLQDGSEVRTRIIKGPLKEYFFLTNKKMENYFRSEEEFEEEEIDDLNEPEVFMKEDTVPLSPEPSPLFENIIPFPGSYKTESYIGLSAGLLKKLKAENQLIKAHIKEVERNEDHISIALQYSYQLKNLLKDQEQEDGAFLYVNSRWVQILSIESSKGNIFLKTINSDVELLPGQEIGIRLPSFTQGVADGWENNKEKFTSLVTKLHSKKKINSTFELTSEEAQTIKYNDLYPRQRECFQLLSNETGFIWGPPGTGKTTTLKKLLHYLLLQNKKVLLLTYNNKTLDDVLLKVLHETHASAKRHNRKYARPGLKIDLKELIHYSAELGITEYADKFLKLSNQLDKATNLKEIKEINNQLKTLKKEINEVQKRRLEDANIVAMTCIGASYKLEELKSQKFDYVFFDEAGQIPLCVTTLLSMLAPSVIYAGDPNQLEPVNTNNNDSDLKYWFGQSMFDVTEEQLRDNQVTSFLNIQNRMHPDIGNLVSYLFYNEELESPKNSQFSESRLARANLSFRNRYFSGSVIYVETPGLVTKEREREASANDIVKIVKNMLSNGIEASKIRVINPYRAQEKILQKYLKEEGIKDVHVSTVHKTQGAEYDYVIFDSMIYDGSFLDTRKNLVIARRMMNVAMSRAKRQFVLIAHPRDSLICEFINEIKESASQKFLLDIYQRELPISSVQISNIYTNKASLKKLPAGATEKPFYDETRRKSKKIFTITSRLRFIEAINQEVRDGYDYYIVENIDLTGIDTKNKNLSNMDLSRTTGLTVEMLNSSKTYNNTKFPSMDITGLIFKGRILHGLDLSLVSGLTVQMLNQTAYIQYFIFPAMNLSGWYTHRNIEGCNFSLCTGLSEIKKNAKIVKHCIWPKNAA